MARKKLDPGTHSRSPTSPYQEPYIAEATATGTWHKVEGVWYWFTWNQERMEYWVRIPPPPTNPPGEVHVLVFNDGSEAYDTYAGNATGGATWSETGQDTHNGP